MAGLVDIRYWAFLSMPENVNARDIKDKYVCEPDVKSFSKVVSHDVKRKTTKQVSRRMIFVHFPVKTWRLQ